MSCSDHKLNLKRNKNDKNPIFYCTKMLKQAICYLLRDLIVWFRKLSGGCAHSVTAHWFWRNITRAEIRNEMSSDHNVVVAQPAPVSTALYSDVRVQPVTSADCEAFATLLIDGFESKYVHAAGREKYALFSLNWITLCFKLDTFNYRYNEVLNYEPNV